MRDLRNHTKQVVERIEDGSTMYLTQNGEREFAFSGIDL
jgi:antitoxin (DNA-binding transcriptional repressor) of toxin-antitoxin stability system